MMFLCLCPRVGVALHNLLDRNLLSNLPHTLLNPGVAYQPSHHTGDKHRHRYSGVLIIIWSFVVDTEGRVSGSLSQPRFGRTGEGVKALVT